jgi:tRNA(Ile2) C34 agmatinyltransferase TiaS
VTTLTLPPLSLREADTRGPLDGGGATLLERLDVALEGVRAEGAATCPMCEGRMASAGAVARCEDCGTELD